MENAKYTPGPWQISAHDLNCITAGDEVEVHVGRFDRVEDAILASCAPDLLEAMDLALEYFNSAQVQLSASGQVAHDAARAAIAKAKG